MDNIAVLILAAGFGKRIGSEIPKVIIKTIEKPLVAHVLESVAQIDPERIVVVTGHKRELVERTIIDGASQWNCSAEKIRFAWQKELLGTGHAVMCSLEALSSFTGTVLILYGDVPLTSPDTLRNFLETHQKENATVSVLSLITDKPNSYGRIVRDANGSVTKIVEASDCPPPLFSIREFNAGIYAIDSNYLNSAVRSLRNDNAQGEYYLTDLISAAVNEKKKVFCYPITDDTEVQGVNDFYELHLINAAINNRRVKKLILSGVVVCQPDSLFVDQDVSIARGVVIGPVVRLEGRTTIEEGVVIEGCATIKDSTIQRNARIKLGVCAEKSIVGEEAQVGPFAHLREGSILGNQSRVGNFVETKKAILEKGVKASHLTYLGDCTIGEDTNIGAGTITCNYDGYNKNKTTIGKNVFVGSDTSLVAPVKVGDGAVIGAGSTITSDVEADSLALTRAQQISKPGWAKTRRDMMGAKKEHH